MNGLFPEDSAERKTYPVYSGLLQYFPAALARVARHSYAGNQKHNPGQPLHHDRAKSDDEADALVRHLMEGDYVGMAWRALSLLQKHCEAQGAPIAPGARNAKPPAPIPHERAAEMIRDGVVPSPWPVNCIPDPARCSEGMCYSPNFDGPPNCEGMPIDPLKDDDEGGPGEPPREGE